MNPAGIRRSRRVGPKVLLFQALDGLADGLVDAFERLLTCQRVVGKHQSRSNLRATTLRYQTRIGGFRLTTYANVVDQIRHT